MQGRGSSNHCVCVCVCVSACVSERENPGKFGGRRDNIPFVLLSRQLLSKRSRKHCFWLLELQSIGLGECSRLNSGQEQTCRIEQMYCSLAEIHCHKWL